MRRLRRMAEVYDYEKGMYWAKNIRTNGLVKVKILNYDYDATHCEVRYLDHNYIVANDDLIGIPDYNKFVEFAEQNGISFDDAEQAMIKDIPFDQWKEEVLQQQ